MVRVLCVLWWYTVGMKVTLYVRDVDADVWAWAKTQAEADRDSLSRVVVDALRALRDEETHHQPANRNTTQ